MSEDTLIEANNSVIIRALAHSEFNHSEYTFDYHDNCSSHNTDNPYIPPGMEGHNHGHSHGDGEDYDKNSIDPMQT